MKLVFFGSGAFGLPTLKRLSVEHEVDLVVTQPDRPAGRGRSLTPTPIAAFAHSKGLKVAAPEDAEELTRERALLEASAFVVIAYGHKLSPQLLGEKFAINLHASLLPKYRGAAPINWAMINGEANTGLSVITLARRMDAGDILAQRSTPVDPHETAGELHDRLAAMGPDLVDEVLESFERATLKPRTQDESQATLAPKLSKADGTVSFDQPALRVRQRIHGLTPWPGCTVSVQDRTLRLARVEEVPGGEWSGEPGIVLPDGTIACAAGAIRPLAVQPPGGKMMSFTAYCNGQPLDPGARFGPI